MNICYESLKISIIVPVYNVEEELESCLQSIVSQQYKNIEIVLTDDGTCDRSACICDFFAEEYDSVIVIHKQNGGVSSARNRGLDLASGELITFVDSDDTIDSDMYEVLMSFLDENTDIVHCSYKRIQDAETKNIGGSGEVLVQSSSEAMEFFLLGKRFTGSLWNKLFRKTIIKSCRLDESLVNNEDFLFCFQLFSNARNITFVDVCKYNYLVRMKSATNTVNELRKINDSTYVCRYMYENVTDEYLKQIAFNRLMATDLMLYHCLLKNQISQKRTEVNERLKKYKKEFSRLSKRNKIILISLLYIPHIYCGVYGIYDKIRKPNWDVN